MEPSLLWIFQELKRKKMKANKLSICIIDDSLPFQNFLDQIDETLPISTEQLSIILDSNVLWPDEEYLRSLTRTIIDSSLLKEGLIDLKWSLYPNFCINAVINDKYLPDLIIYDWEYRNYPLAIGETTVHASSESLLALLNLLPQSFFFIYSNKAQFIPIKLFQNKLDRFANRFQVLPKGDHQLILSAEDMIYNYIILKINNQTKIKIGQKEIDFDSSGHLKTYKDILYLEGIMGKEYLNSQINKIKDKVSDTEISEMFDDFDFKIFLSADESLLITEKNEFTEKKYGPLLELSYKEAFDRFGLITINDALNNNIIKL